MNTFINHYSTTTQTPATAWTHLLCLPVVCSSVTSMVIKGRRCLE